MPAKSRPRRRRRGTTTTTTRRAHTTGLLRRDPLLVSRTQQRQGGEKKKKKKKREQCTATASVVVPQPHLCCCPAYFFPPHCARRRSRHTPHTTPAQYESTRAHMTRGVPLSTPSSIDGAGRGDERTSKKVTTTQWALPPSRWALGGLGEQLLQQALPLVAARLVVDPWCRLRRWGVRGWQQWEQG